MSIINKIKYKNHKYYLVRDRGKKLQVFLVPPLNNYILWIFELVIIASPVEDVPYGHRRIFDRTGLQVHNVQSYYFSYFSIA